MKFALPRRRGRRASPTRAANTFSSSAARLGRALLAWSLLAFTAAALAVGPGDTAPDFALVNDRGEVVRLADLRDTPVVLNAWATWCPFCVDEIPLFDAAHDDLGDAVAFALVNLDEPFDLAREFLRDDVDSDLLALYDPTDEHRASHPDVEFANTRELLTRTYRVRGMPTTFFVDAQGVVQRVKVGPILSRAELESLLAEIGVEANLSASAR